MRCKHCSTKITSDHKYCPRCGATLETQKMKSSSSSRNVESRCDFCNGTLKNSEAFCSHCGKANEAYQEPQKKRSDAVSSTISNDSANHYVPSTPQYEVSTSRPLKSRTVAGLLAIFLGTLGVHNFYLGNTTKAIVQLLVTFFGGAIGGPVIVMIWGFVEGIMILSGSINTDGYNRLLKN